MHIDQAADLYRHSSQIAEAKGNGRIVVMALGSRDAVPVALEGSALAIWNEIDGEQTVGEILGGLAAQFGLEPHEIANDVLPSIAQFAAHGLIERVESA